MADYLRQDFINKAKEEIGKVYGDIKVVGVSDIRTKKGTILHEAVCLRCGSPFVFLVRIQMLRNGNTKSCGCLRSDIGKERVAKWNKQRKEQQNENEQTD